MVNLDEIEIISPMPKDFRTHLNYVLCASNLSKDLNLKLNFKINSKLSFDKKELSNKVRLIELIKESIDEEHKKAIKEKDFAKICSMWIPVKSYYLIFNMLLVLCALINDEKENLKYSHAKAIGNFRTMIKNKNILFNNNNFNLVLSCKDANDFVSKSGDTLREEIDDDTRVKSVLKKLCKYKFEDFCRYKCLKDFRSNERKKQRKSFLNSFFSLFDNANPL